MMKPKFLNQPSIVSNAALNARIVHLEQVNIISWLYQTVKQESKLNKSRSKINPRRPYVKVKEFLKEHDIDVEIIEEMMAHDNEYL